MEKTICISPQRSSSIYKDILNRKKVVSCDNISIFTPIFSPCNPQPLVVHPLEPPVRIRTALFRSTFGNPLGYSKLKRGRGVSLSRRNGLRIQARATKKHPGFGGSQSRRQKGGKSTSNGVDFGVSVFEDPMFQRLIVLWLSDPHPRSVNELYQMWFKLPTWKTLGLNNPSTLDEAFKLLGWPLSYKPELASCLAQSTVHQACSEDPRFSYFQFTILAAVEKAVELTPIGDNFEKRFFDKLKDFSPLTTPTLSECHSLLSLLDAVLLRSKAQFYCFYYEFRTRAFSGLEKQLRETKFSDHNEAFEFAFNALRIQGIDSSTESSVLADNAFKLVMDIYEPNGGFFSSFMQILKGAQKMTSKVAEFVEEERMRDTLRKELRRKKPMMGVVQRKFRDKSSVLLRRRGPFILEFLSVEETTVVFSWEMGDQIINFSEKVLQDDLESLATFSSMTSELGYPKEEVVSKENFVSSRGKVVQEQNFFDQLRVSDVVNLPFLEQNLFQFGIPGVAVSVSSEVIWQTSKDVTSFAEKSPIKDVQESENFPEMMENEKMDMGMNTDSAFSKKPPEVGSVIDKQSESEGKDESEDVFVINSAQEDIKNVKNSALENARSEEVQPVQVEALVNLNIDREDSDEKMREETDGKGREERGIGAEGQGSSGESGNGAQVERLPSSHALLNEETSGQSNSKPLSIVQDTNAKEFVSPGNGSLMQDVTSGLENNVSVSRELEANRDHKEEEGKEEEKEEESVLSKYQSDVVTAEVKPSSSIDVDEVSSKVLSTEASDDEIVSTEVDEVSYATQMWLHAEHAYLRLRQCVGRSWEGWVRAVAYAGAYNGVLERVIHFLMSSEDDGFLLERGVIIKVMTACQLGREDLFARYEAMCGERAFTLPQEKILNLSNLACKDIPSVETLQSVLSSLRRDLEGAQHIDDYFSRVVVNGSIPLPPVSPVRIFGVDREPVHSNSDSSNSSNSSNSSDGDNGSINSISSKDKKTDANTVTDGERIAQLQGNSLISESSQNLIIPESTGIQIKINLQGEDQLKSTNTNGSKLEKFACPKCKQRRWSSKSSHWYKKHVSSCMGLLDSPNPVNKNRNNGNNGMPSSNMSETNSASVRGEVGGDTTQFLDSRRGSSGNQSEDEGVIGGRNTGKRRGIEERKEGKLSQEAERMSGRDLAIADERRRSSKAMAGGAEPLELEGVRRPEWHKIDTDPFFYVVDTNVLMDPDERAHLEYIATPRDGSTGRATIVVPCVVGRELENISRNPSKQKEDREAAANAFKWYNRHLRKETKWLHAAAKEEMVLPFPSTVFCHKDDEILGVLAYFNKCHPGRAFLLTHDQPMQNKALHNCALMWLLPLVIQDDGCPPPRYLKAFQRAQQASKQALTS